jgi:hypothetical protein
VPETQSLEESTVHVTCCRCRCPHAWTSATGRNDPSEGEQRGKGQRTERSGVDEVGLQVGDVVPQVERMRPTKHLTRASQPNGSTQIVT